MSAKHPERPQVVARVVPENYERWMRWLADPERAKTWHILWQIDTGAGEHVMMIEYRGTFTYRSLMLFEYSPEQRFGQIYVGWGQ